MRDLPSTSDLLDLARRVSAEELPPAERQRHAHLVATAQAIAAREAEAGERWQREIAAALVGFYEDVCRPGESRDPPVDRSNLGEVDPGFRRDDSLDLSGGGRELLARLAADLRNGAFETTPSRESAARAILWRLVLAKLREANPQFLAANGFADGSN
jgi:hypothetical protein